MHDKHSCNRTYRSFNQPAMLKSFSFELVNPSHAFHNSRPKQNTTLTLYSIIMQNKKALKLYNDVPWFDFRYGIAMELSSLYLKYKLFNMTVLLFLIILERYHLFVWTVFAPKLLYEISTLTLSCLFYILTIISSLSSREQPCQS